MKVQSAGQLNLLLAVAGCHFSIVDGVPKAHSGRRQPCSK
jgi:hypothetical protein